MLREGLRLDEQHAIIRELEQQFKDGAKEDAAYSIAQRVVTGVKPQTLAAWKDTLLRRARGEEPAETPLPRPQGGFPGTPHAKIAQLTEENEKLAAEHKKLQEEHERLKASVLEGPGKKK